MIRLDYHFSVPDVTGKLRAVVALMMVVTTTF